MSKSEPSSVAGEKGMGGVIASFRNFFTRTRSVHSPSSPKLERMGRSVDVVGPPRGAMAQAARTTPNFFSRLRQNRTMVQAPKVAIPQTPTEELFSAKAKKLEAVLPQGATVDLATGSIRGSSSPNVTKMVTTIQQGKFTGTYPKELEINGIKVSIPSEAYADWPRQNMTFGKETFTNTNIGSKEGQEAVAQRGAQALLDLTGNNPQAAKILAACTTQSMPTIILRSHVAANDPTNKAKEPFAGSFAGASKGKMVISNKDGTRVNRQGAGVAGAHIHLTKNESGNYQMEITWNSTLIKGARTSTQSASELSQLGVDGILVDSTLTYEIDAHKAAKGEFAIVGKAICHHSFSGLLPGGPKGIDELNLLP